jgi:hypothetical protein
MNIHRITPDVTVLSDSVTSGIDALEELLASFEPAG